MASSAFSKLTAVLLLGLALLSAIPIASSNGDEVLTPETITDPALIIEAETGVNPMKAVIQRVQKAARKLYVTGPGRNCTYDPAYCSLNCFPADALVATGLDGQTQLLSEIRAGDQVVVLDVATGQLKVEQVLVNDLQGIDAMAEHVTLGTASGHIITATPDHQIFVSLSQGRAADLNALDFVGTAKIVPTANIQIGDVIWVNEASANGAPLSPLPVTSINRGTKRGMLNPVTASGTLVVNGVLATTYTTKAADFMPVELTQAF